MNKPAKARDNAYLRRMNSQAVLRAIRRNGRIGRSVVARATGLSIATVCRVADDLIARSLVVEADSVSIGGAKRKTALLDINPAGGWVLAVDLSGDRIRTASVDFLGNIQKTAEFALENTQGEEAVTPRLIGAIKKSLRWANGQGDLRAVGISSTGIVDPEQGVVRLSFHLQLRDYPISRIVQEATGIPTVVCNDVSAATLAEARLGSGKECPNFAYVYVGNGVGAGLVIGGQVMNLPQEAEFGLMVVSSEGDPEMFEGRGYLESVASGRGIVSAYRHRLAHSAAESGTSQDVGNSIQEVLKAAETGDELAVEAVARAAGYLGIGVVNLAHALGLTMFVVGGEIPSIGNVFWQPLRESVAKHEFWPGRIQLQTTSLRQDSRLLGVGNLALDLVLDTIG